MGFDRIIAGACTMVLSLSLACTVRAENAPLKAASIFGDHMILQQDKAVPVWGTSLPQATITVQFDGQTVQTTSDEKGAWRLHLKPLKAKATVEQKPQVLTISDGTNKQEFSDVLIGEVWVGAGQSNMNRTISEAAAAGMKPIPGLRILDAKQVKSEPANKKENKPKDFAWRSLDADGKEASGFSNMLLPFGARMTKELNVPVGLMLGAAGGTDSGRWLAPGGGSNPELVRVAGTYEKRYSEFVKQYENDVAAQKKEDADWEARLLPFLRNHWEYLTKADAKGARDPAIEKFIASGADIKKVAKLSDLSAEQRKQLDDALTPLIKSNGPEGQAGLALVDDFVRATHPERLDLKPFWLSWHYGWGMRHPLPLDAEKPPAPKKPGTQGGDLFANHISPMVPFAIRGVLWDQGESGTGIPGVDQFTLMTALIESWRAQWKDEFSWVYVQKPSGEGCRLVYDDKDVAVRFQAKLPEFIPDPNWGLYREIHVRIGTLPDTFMVASSDLGPGVHPQDKNRYGTRAAEVALNKVYKKDIQSSGPVYRSHKVDGGKMRITFKEVGAGLVAGHAENPQGFAIAGVDRKFVWADAKIIAPDTVELFSDQVKEPVAARYAYSCYIPWANLFNKEGIPAATFRTDDWTWEGQNPVFVWKLFFTASRRMNWVWDPAPATKAVSEK